MSILLFPEKWVRPCWPIEEYDRRWQNQGYDGPHLKYEDDAKFQKLQTLPGNDDGKKSTVVKHCESVKLALKLQQHTEAPVKTTLNGDMNGKTRATLENMESNCFGRTEPITPKASGTKLNRNAKSPKAGARSTPPT